jgi:hypothetical protein
MRDFLQLFAEAHLRWTCRISDYSFVSAPPGRYSRLAAPMLNVIPQLIIRFHLWSTWFMFGLPSQNYLTYNNRIVDRNSKTTATTRIFDARVRCIAVYEMSLWSLNCFFYIRFTGIQWKSCIRFFFFVQIFSQTKIETPKILKTIDRFGLLDRKNLRSIFNLYPLQTDKHTTAFYLIWPSLQSRE